MRKIEDDEMALKVWGLSLAAENGDQKDVAVCLTVIATAISTEDIEELAKFMTSYAELKLLEGVIGMDAVTEFLRQTKG